MNRMKLMAVALASGLAGCSATTSFQSSPSDLSLRVNEGSPLNLAQSHTYPTTSFGQYKFKAEQPGQDPMYGILPLKFNGGYLAADILFFAPALFFNLREVFPHYQIDAEKQEIRYRKKPSEAWSVYRPTPDEIQHAKTYFSK